MLKETGIKKSETCSKWGGLTYCLYQRTDGRIHVPKEYGMFVAS